MIVWKYENFGDEDKHTSLYYLNYFAAPKFWQFCQFFLLFFRPKKYVDATIEIDQFNPFDKDVEWKNIKLDYKGIDLKEWLTESTSGCFHLMITDGESILDTNKYIRIYFYNQTDLMAFKILMS